jgi:drug/metabolite transporter superfamily protein YnfA
MQSVAWFILAGLFEIGGGYLVRKMTKMGH